MQRIVTQRDMNDGTVRHRVRIEGDDCLPDSVLSEQLKWSLMSNLVDNPALVACGPVNFQKLSIYHDGSRWVLEAEAFVRTTNGKDAASP